MTLDVLDGTWAWVWKEAPEPIRFCRGLIVRAANGNGVTDPQGFNFQTNYQRWRASFAGPLIAWTYLYNTSNPEAAGLAVTEVDAVAYIIDWEDAAGPSASADSLRRTVAEIRRQRPGRPVGFSSYPTRAQALAHGVDWDVGIAVCDFVAPQSYYDYQQAQYAQTIADAKGRYVQLDVEPATHAHWERYTGLHLDTGQGVSFWRLGILTPQDKLAIQAFEEAHDVTIADVKAAVQEVLAISDHLAVPQGQQNNDRLASILVSGVQSMHNTLAQIATAQGAIADEVAALAAKIDALTPGTGGTPGPIQVSGTFTGTAAPGGAQ